MEWVVPLQEKWPAQWRFRRFAGGFTLERGCENPF
jgi:hypothetical protein